MLLPGKNGEILDLKRIFITGYECRKFKFSYSCESKFIINGYALAIILVNLQMEGSSCCMHYNN